MDHERRNVSAQTFSSGTFHVKEQCNMFVGCLMHNPVDIFSSSECTLHHCIVILCQCGSRLSADLKHVLTADVKRT